MLLKDYIPNIKKKLRLINFSGIAFESRKVKKDYIFFAIKGKKFDGNNYIQEAIKKGAKIIVSEKRFIKKKNKIIFLFSSNIRKLLAETSYRILNKKTKKISCGNRNKWKIICCRFLLSNIITKFKEGRLYRNSWYKV